MNDSSANEPLPVEVDAQSVAAMRDNGRDFLLLDVREPDEYATAKIEGATLIPMGEIGRRREELEPFRDRHVVVHCHHGVRSMRVVEALRQSGFSKVQNLAGGIDAWSLEVDPSVPRY